LSANQGYFGIVPSGSHEDVFMRLTTKGRFAVTAMIDLASRQDKGPVTLTGIAERQNISLSYLEQLFSRLRRYNLVSSVRGPGGGYKLARDMREITVTDIVLAVDEPLDATRCGGRQNCRDTEQCLTHDLWSNLNKRMFVYLDSVTLGALVAREVHPDPDIGMLKAVFARMPRHANETAPA
jgi:Rrf2 family iron-sulfur cluster assembly transcriptional regulator